VRLLAELPHSDRPAYPRNLGPKWTLSNGHYGERQRLLTCGPPTLHEAALP